MRNRVGERFVEFLNAEQSSLEHPEAAVYYTSPLMFQGEEAVVVSPPKNTKMLIKLRRELRSDVSQLIQGQNIAEIERKLNQPEPPRVLHLIKQGDKHQIANMDIHCIRGVTLGDSVYSVALMRPMDRSVRTLAYGFLKNLLLSGEINKITICACGKFIFQKTKRARFCSDQCRWEYFNHAEGRKKYLRKGKRYSDKTG